MSVNYGEAKNAQRRTSDLLVPCLAVRERWVPAVSVILRGVSVGGSFAPKEIFLEEGHVQGARKTPRGSVFGWGCQLEGRT
jgi:hypothetical protein